MAESLTWRRLSVQQATASADLVGAATCRLGRPSPQHLQLLSPIRIIVLHTTMALEQSRVGSTVGFRKSAQIIVEKVQAHAGPSLRRPRCAAGAARGRSVPEWMSWLALTARCSPAGQWACRQVRIGPLAMAGPTCAVRAVARLGHGPSRPWAMPPALISLTLRSPTSRAWPAWPSRRCTHRRGGAAFTLHNICHSTSYGCFATAHR